MSSVGRIARGSYGAGLLTRIYRRSPVRWYLRVQRDHRGLRPNDVFLASYPRSGSSWMRFLVMEMTTGEASFDSIRFGVPYVGKQLLARPLLADGGRVIKTHEIYRPMYRRAIHLVRDPRDIAISYFRFMQRLRKIDLRPEDDEEASFDHFLDVFLRGRVDAHGTWQSHVLSWVAAADSGRADVLRLRYEDLRADPPANILRIAAWLDLDLDADAVAQVAERTTIERMREAEDYANANTPDIWLRRVHESGVSIINKGAVGGWRERLNAEQQARFRVFNEGLALMGYETA